MSDPVTTSTAVSTLTIGAGGIVIAGVYTGLDYDVLISGLVGALMAIRHMDASSSIYRGFQVIGFTLLAAWASPVAAAWASAQITSIGAPAARLPLSFLIAYLLPVALPRAIEVVKSWQPSK